MDFSTLVNDKIMPEVKSGSDEPIIIYRDSNGGWHGDFTQNQYGNEFDWVEDVKKQDPLAFTTTGAEYAKGSNGYVYDKVFTERLRLEYDLFFNDGTNYGEQYALIGFLEDNICEFSRDVTDYLMELEKPFAALNEMIPQNLKKGLAFTFPDDDIQEETIDCIQNIIKERLDNRSNTKTANREEHNTALPVIDMKKLENALLQGGFSNDEVQAIWHTVWDYSGDWLKVFDERFMKSEPTIKPTKQKPSLSERIEKGKEKVRESDKSKDKTVKPKKTDKEVVS